jgi:cardiolipin synthase
MNLHRTLGKPDWQSVPLSSRSVWQQTAASTGGFATPGNVLTTFGLGAVVTGLLFVSGKHYPAALALVTCGRLLDLADGWIADRTGTKGPVGEVFDASADKLATLLTIIVLGVTGLAPLWTLLVLLVPQLAVAVLSLALRQRGHALHPSLLGKFSMAALWASLLLFLAATATGDIGWLTYAACAAAVVSGALGLGAFSGYLGTNVRKTTSKS